NCLAAKCVLFWIQRLSKRLSSFSCSVGSGRVDPEHGGGGLVARKADPAHVKFSKDWRFQIWVRLLQRIRLAHSLFRSTLASERVTQRQQGYAQVEPKRCFSNVPIVESALFFRCY